jgi:hypothetical protein
MEGKEEILPSPQFYKAILQCLGLTEELVTKNDETSRLSNIIEKLTTTDEETAQKELNEQWMMGNHTFDCFAIDSHASNNTLPIFKFSHPIIREEENQNVFPQNPNFISSIAPMYLELLSLKGKTTQIKRMETIYEALVQLIERVHLCAIQNETLQRVVGFATVGNRSWIFIVRRDYSKLDTLSGKLHETFDLCPIEAASILPIWRAYNRLAEANSQVFVQPVAFILAQLLAVLGYHAGYCSIQYETNRSNVFTITPGVKKKKIHSAYDNNHHNRHEVYFSTPAASCQNSFVIKLTEGLSPSLLRRATNELEVLNKLKGSLAANYVIATVSTSSSQGLTINEFDTSFFKNNHININTAVSEGQEKTTSISSSVVTTVRFTDPFFSSADLEHCSSKECIPDAFWWNYRRISVAPEYRAVIMRKGYGVLSYCSTPVRQRFREVLAAIHRKGIVHCDLLPNNLMDFEDNLYIIDFDVAVDLGEAVSVNLKLRPGAQKDFLEHEMRVIDRGDRVIEWTEMLDTEMIMKALDSLPTMPAFTFPKSVYESADITIFEENEVEADDESDKEEEDD